MSLRLPREASKGTSVAVPHNSRLQPKQRVRVLCLQPMSGLSTKVAYHAMKMSTKAVRKARRNGNHGGEKKTLRPRSKQNR